MKTDDFFATHPIFTYAEFIQAINGERGRSQKTINASLQHYSQTGRITNIRKGLYAVIPVGHNAENFAIDPFLLASKLADDAILGYHTALQYYGRAYSLAQRYFIITSRKLWPFKFRNQSFQIIKPPHKLILKHQELFEVEMKESQGISIRVTSLERTLVDLLDRPDLGLGWEEIWRSLEMIEYFKLDKVIEYVLLRDNAALTARVGFYLEQHQSQLMVSENHLKILEEHIPKQPFYFDKKKSKGQLIKRWNLIVPQSILEKTWEEIL